MVILLAPTVHIWRSTGTSTWIMVSRIVIKVTIVRTVVKALNVFKLFHTQGVRIQNFESLE